MPHTNETKPCTYEEIKTEKVKDQNKVVLPAPHSASTSTPPVSSPSSESRSNIATSASTSSPGNYLHSPYFLLVGAFSRIGEQHIATNTSRQDAFIVPSPAQSWVPAWCSLFDGHGAIGEQVSAFCAAQLPKLLCAQKLEEEKWLPDFHQAYAALNKAVRANDKWAHAGCTALSIYITSRVYLTAQTGDAVALLASHNLYTGHLRTQALHPTLHRLSNQREVQRLSKQNAKFSGPYVKSGSHKLMVTRDIGNASFGDLVIPTPDCSILERTENDSFIVMATDGAWEESESPEHLVSLVTRCLIQRYQQSRGRNEWEQNERKFLNQVCKDFILSLDARSTLRDDSTLILILLRPVSEIVELVTRVRQISLKPSASLTQTSNKNNPIC